MPVEKRSCCGADDVNVFVSYLLMAKKPDKYSKRAKIGADIDRMFPNHKEGGSFIYIDEKNNTSQVVKGTSTGMVLEQGNFAWTKEELDVAESKGIKINS